MDIFDKIKKPVVGGGNDGFEGWYAGVSAKNNLDPNPDDPRHFYDYRAAYRDGVRAPDDTGHWPSKYKTEGHPRMVVDGVNTKTGEPSGDIFDQIRASKQTQTGGGGGDIFDQITAPKVKAEPGMFDGILKNPNMQGLIGASKAVGSAAVNETAALATDVAKNAYLPDTATQSVRGLAQGMAGFGLDVLKRMESMATQLAMKGDIDWETVKAVGEHQTKLMEYEPTDPGAKAILGAIGSVPQGIKIFFDTIAEQYKDKPNITAGLQTLGDLAELAAFGKVFHALKLKGPESPKPGEWSGIDATFAKNQVRENIAKERASTKSRPLDKLVREEESIAADKVPTNDQVRIKKYEGLFDEIADKEAIAEMRPHQEPPVLVDGKPIPPEPIVEPAGKNFLERATERLGGKVEHEPVDVFDEIAREYGAKIDDRTVPDVKREAPKQIEGEQRLALPEGQTFETGPIEPIIPLEKYTVKQLKEVAKSLGIPLKHGRTKSHYIRLIKKEQAKLNAPEATAEGVSAPPPGAVAEPAPAAPPLRTETTPRSSGAGEATPVEIYHVGVSLKPGEKFKSDHRSLVWFAPTEKKYGANKPGVPTTTIQIPRNKLLVIEDATGKPVDSIGQKIIKESETGSKQEVFEAAEKLGYEAVQRVNDISMRPQTAEKYIIEKKPTLSPKEAKAVAEPAPAAPPLRTETTPRSSGAGDAKLVKNTLYEKFKIRAEDDIQRLEQDIDNLQRKLDDARNREASGDSQISAAGKKDRIYYRADQIRAKQKIKRLRGDIKRVRRDNPDFYEDANTNTPESVAKENGIVFRHMQEGNPLVKDSKPSYSFYDPLTKEAIGGKEPDFSVTNLEDVPSELAKIRASRGLELLDDGTLGKVASEAPTKTLESLDAATTADIARTERKIAETERGSTDSTKGTVEAETPSRNVKDIIKDVNTFLGEKGSVGKDIGKMTPEQQAAYVRLSKDFDAIKRNAEKVGKDIKTYLMDIGYNPEVATMLAKKADELPKYAGSVNLQKQNIPDEYKQIESEIAKPKKVQKWATTEKMSDTILQDYKRAEKTLRKKGHTAAEIDAIRQINANAVNDLKRLADSDISPEKFAEQFDRYRADIFNKVSDASSEVGRALNIHKKEISIDRVGKAFAKLKRNLNARELKEFKELNIENPAEIKRFLNRLGDPKLSEYALEFWYNNILSGIPTHLVNATSNTLWQEFQIPHRALSALIDIPYSRLKGTARQRYLNEIPRMIRGQVMGWKRGKKLAKETLTKGKISDFESKWAEEMGSSIGAFDRSPSPFLRKVGKVMTVPTRALRAMDIWANAIAYDAHIDVLARRRVNELIKKGKLTEKERAAKEKQLRENPPEEFHDDAMKQARYSTFMDDPDPATRLLIQLRNVPVIGPLARFTIMPFVNTISNLTKRGLEMTPVVGIAKEAISRGMGRGSYTPDVIAKQIEGAIISLYILKKFQDGDITGPMPENPSERDAWYRQGKKPWGIRFHIAGKDRWIEYRRIEPFNTVIASAAMFHEKVLNREDEDSLTQAFGDLASAMKDNVVDGSYFSSLKDILDKNTDLSKPAARFTASWVPYSSFWRSINRSIEVITDGESIVHEGNEWLKAFSQVIPGLSGKMPAKLDVWGERSVLPGGVFRQWLPYKWSTEIDDPVEKALEELEIYPSRPTKKIKINGESVEIPDDLYRQYAIDYGSELKAEWMKLVSQTNYKNASDERKKKALESRRRRIGNRARARLRKEMDKQ